jgi:hypothetical protein
MHYFCGFSIEERLSQSYLDVVKLGESLGNKKVGEGDVGEKGNLIKWSFQMNLFSSSKSKEKRRSKKNLR